MYILDEVIMGGLVLETNLPDIIRSVDEQNRLEKDENPFAGLRSAIEGLRRG